MKMKIINGAELKRLNIYCGLIFGQPGSGKSTLAVSASKPVLLDIDLGANRIKTKDRKNAGIAQFDNYDELIQYIYSGALSQFDTIIIDTFGAVVDMIIRDKFGGSMTPMKWGLLKTEFMKLVGACRLTGKSVLFIAHENEEKNDDKVIKRPQCQGRAKDELMKVLDFIGYLHRGVSNSYVLEFGGDESFYSKNTFGFENKYILPDVNFSENNFWKTTIETTIKEFLESEDKAISELMEKIGDWDKRIESAKTADEFNAIVDDLACTEGLSGGAIVKLKKNLMAHGEKIDVLFNAESKKFQNKGK
jgi:hypothetical protein